MANHVCPWWLAYTFDNPLRRLFHKPEEMFGSYLKEGMIGVDLGCGMGYFSINMAGLVGETGKILGVDLQPQMLKVLSRRAQKAGVGQRITTVLCDEHDIGINQEVDFALAFWMAHETPDQRSFLKQVHACLKEPGRLFLAEPKIHVTLSEFQKTLAIAQEVGFKQIETPKVFFSHSVVFEKA